MTTVVSVVEHGGWTTAGLTDGQAAALIDSNIVKIKRGATRGTWQARATRFVGIARFGSGDDAVVVRIAPKTPIGRLLFLVGYAADERQVWKDVEVDVRAAPDLVPVAAHAFARAAERALGQGVLLGYRETEEAAVTVRGRIRVAEQIRHRYGLSVPVEMRFDNYTIDIPENRLLRAAAERLLTLSDLMPTTRRMLTHMLPSLADTARLDPRGPLPSWQATHLNARYHSALGLAEMVLAGSSYELEDGTRVRVDGLLFDMWRVFEGFITRALTDALGPYGGYCRAQPEHKLDIAGQITLRPDLVRYAYDDSGVAVPVGVADAKYTVDTGAHGHNPALYQLLAYCTALGLARGHLVYVRDAVPQRTHTVHRAGIEIIEHYLDLTTSPADLRDQIARIAADVALS